MSTTTTLHPGERVSLYYPTNQDPRPLTREMRNVAEHVLESFASDALHVEEIDARAHGFNITALVLEDAPVNRLFTGHLDLTVVRSGLVATYEAYTPLEGAGGLEVELARAEEWAGGLLYDGAVRATNAVEGATTQLAETGGDVAQGTRELAGDLTDAAGGSLQAVIWGVGIVVVLAALARAGKELQG